MKRRFIYIFMVLLVYCLVGCSSSKNDLDQKELVYGYERLACMDELKGNIINFDVSEDAIYIYSEEYGKAEDEEEQIIPHIYKCKTDGSELEELPVEWNREEFEWLHSIESSGAGHLWILFSAYSDKTMTSTFILCLTDEKGTVVREIDIKEYIDAEDFYVSDIKIDAEGNMYVCSGYSVLCFDETGEFISSIEDGEYIENLVRAKDGFVWAVFSENGALVLKKTEAGKTSFGETKRTNLPFSQVAFDMDGLVCDFYFSMGESLYGYDFPTEETAGGSAELVHFFASGLDTNSIGRKEVISEDAVLITFGVNDEEGHQELYLMRKQDPKEVKERKVVTYASLFYDPEVREKALEFNSSQDEYLVILKNYDYAEDSVKAFYKDLCAGEVIDIVDLTGMTSSGKYTSQEMFVDLYTLMERDKEIKKEDFSEQALRMMETDGHLYCITPMYGINGMFVKESTGLGEKPLTIDRLTELEKDGAKAFFRETKETVLTEMLAMNYDSYIDWESGTSSFDSGEFVKVLEYCNTYPPEVDYSDEENMTGKVQNDEVLFASVYSSAPEDLQVYEEMFGDDVVMIGYPSEEYSGAAMSFHREFAICSFSKDKKGAWQFLKTFLTREYGTGNANDTISVPIRKDSLEDKIKRYTTTKEYTDEFGNHILPISYEWGNEENMIEVGPLSKEGETLYRKVLENMDRKYVYDADMQVIVTQEAQAFFDDEISAQAAAANIQKRVSVYMSDYKKEDKK